MVDTQRLIKQIEQLKTEQDLPIREAAAEVMSKHLLNHIRAIFPKLPFEWRIGKVGILDPAMFGTDAAKALEQLIDSMEWPT